MADYLVAKSATGYGGLFGGQEWCLCPHQPTIQSSFPTTTLPAPPQGIIAQHEGYIDCYLRLACIARRMGAGAEAFKWATRALELQGGHADALALTSQLHMERR